MYIPALGQIELDDTLPKDRQNWLVFREVARSVFHSRGEFAPKEAVEQLAREMALPLTAVDWHDLLNRDPRDVARLFCLPVFVVVERLADVAHQTRISAA